VKKSIVVAIILLAVLHQDFWWWDSRALVFGFMPVGLAWHAFVSLAAATIWLLAVVFCWPHELDEETPAEVQPGRTQEVH
jgi:hypothetical protein